MRAYKMTFNSVRPWLALMLAIVLPASGAAAMSEPTSPRAVVEAKFAAVNRHSIPDIVALYAADAQLTASDFCRPRQGHADVERTYRGIFASVPDAFDEVQEYVVQGERVAVRFVLRGTYSGRPFEVPLMDFFTVRDGLIVADDGLFDNGGRKCAP